MSIYTALMGLIFTVPVGLVVAGVDLRKRWIKLSLRTFSGKERVREREEADGGWREEREGDKRRAKQAGSGGVAGVTGERDGVGHAGGVSVICCSGWLTG